MRLFFFRTIVCDCDAHVLAGVGLFSHDLDDVGAVPSFSHKVGSTCIFHLHVLDKP